MTSSISNPTLDRLNAVSMNANWMRCRIGLAWAAFAKLISVLRSPYTHVYTRTCKPSGHLFDQARKKGHLNLISSDILPSGKKVIEANEMRKMTVANQFGANVLSYLRRISLGQSSQLEWWWIIFQSRFIFYPRLCLF